MHFLWSIWARLNTEKIIHTITNEYENFHCERQKTIEFTICWISLTFGYLTCTTMWSHFLSVSIIFFLAFCNWQNKLTRAYQAMNCVDWCVFGCLRSADSDQYSRVQLRHLTGQFHSRCVHWSVPRHKSTLIFDRLNHCCRYVHSHRQRYVIELLASRWITVPLNMDRNQPPNQMLCSHAGINLSQNFFALALTNRLPNSIM